MTEGRDWSRTQFEACPDCGFDPGSHVDGVLGDALTTAAADWRVFLVTTADQALRARPGDGTWTALEYGAHTRDVLGIFGRRIERMLVESSSRLGWWDHEAAAIDEAYNEQDPAAVGDALAANAATLAAVLPDGAGDAWDRSATRRPGEEFTVRGAARFAVHETVHHHRDAATRVDRGWV